MAHRIKRFCSICEEYFFPDMNDDEYEDMCPECKREFNESDDNEDEEDDDEPY